MLVNHYKQLLAPTRHGHPARALPAMLSPPTDDLAEAAVSPIQRRHEPKRWEVFVRAQPKRFDEKYLKSSKQADAVRQSCRRQEFCRLLHGKRNFRSGGRVYQAVAG
jgi:hypothetical protein